MLERLSRMHHSHEFWLLLIIILLCIVLTVINPVFLTLRNVSDLLTSNAYVAVLSAGLVVVLIAGGIDVSFTAIASVAQYVALSVANAYPSGWFGVFAVACAVGSICGLANAVVIYKFKIKSIIATIATLNVFYGLLIIASGGTWISVLPDWFQSGISWFEFTDSEDFIYSVNVQILILVLGFALTWVLLRRTNIGRQIYAMGGSPEGARRLGFGIFKLHLIVYGYMGFVAGLASVIQAQLAQTVMPNSLVGKELDVLAAVVLGGASLVGGVGSVLGTILGVALLAIIQNGLLLVGVSSYWLQFFSGLVILVAMALTALRSQKRSVRRTVTA